MTDRAARVTRARRVGRIAENVRFSHAVGMHEFIALHRREVLGDRSLVESMRAAPRLVDETEAGARRSR
jgi:hypothetical protein